MALKLLSRDFYKTADFQRTRGIEIKIRGRICNITFKSKIRNYRWKIAQNKEPKKIDVLYWGIEEVSHKYVFYLYKNNLYFFDEKDIHTPEEQRLLIKEKYFKQQNKFAKLQKEIRLFEKQQSEVIKQSREPIPEDIRFSVWRRDCGKCVKCGSNKNLEFDHIIPVSKGGSNTERNIQILCERCNRKKSNRI